MHRKKFLQLATMSPMALFAEPVKYITDLFDNNSDVNVIYYKKGDAAYEELRKGFNKRINKFPAIIAFCKNVLGVSEAIKLAVKNNLPVAVKSGGHCMEGFSCNNNGMVINLSAINKVEWLDANTIRVGPACKLAELYNEILPKNKIIPGGSCAGVGIGGLTLGGGYGLLARKFGLTCDSLQAVTMVDGKGNIVDSNFDKELLWACKGGNNGNFGVVTSMTFKVHDAPATMQSFKFRSYNVNTARAKNIANKWFEVSKNLPDSCFSAFVLNHKTLYILITNAGKHTPALQQVIDELKSVSDKNTNSIKQPLATALKNYYGRKDPLYFKNASAGLYKSYSEIAGCIEKAFDLVIATPGMIYQVNTLGGKILNKDFETASAFPHRDCLYFSELQTYWEQPSQEKRLLQQFQQVQEVFIKHGITAQYRNYPDINFTNWKEYYYSKNYARLQKLKQKFDSGNLFRYEQSLV